MTKAELADAVSIARSKYDLDDVDDSILDGCYLPGFPAVVSTTIHVVAKFIRWHCVYLNGQLASEELDEFAQFARRRIQIIG